MRVVHAPVEIPRLKEYRSIDGRGMCYLSGWKILNKRLYITLSNKIEGPCEIDLEEEASSMGFVQVASVVAAAGGSLLWTLSRRLSMPIAIRYYGYLSSMKHWDPVLFEEKKL
jgi:hypothetical protein